MGGRLPPLAPCGGGVEPSAPRTARDGRLRDHRQRPGSKILRPQPRQNVASTASFFARRLRRWATLLTPLERGSSAGGLDTMSAGSLLAACTPAALSTASNEELEAVAALCVAERERRAASSVGAGVAVTVPTSRAAVRPWDRIRCGGHDDDCSVASVVLYEAIVRADDVHGPCRRGHVLRFVMDATDEEISAATAEGHP